MLNCWLAVCLSVIRSEALCGSLRGRFKAPSWSVPAAPVLSPNWQVQPLFGCRNHYAVSLNSHHFCLVRQCQRTEGEKKKFYCGGRCWGNYMLAPLSWWLYIIRAPQHDRGSLLTFTAVRRMRGDCRRKFSLVLFPDEIQDDWDSCPWLLTFTELTVWVSVSGAVGFVFIPIFWDLSMCTWGFYCF